jgi:putative FmdB family regulatory protein
MLSAASLPGRPAAIAGTRAAGVPGALPILRAMPIYEYRCTSGHTFETLQRMTDDPLTTCQTCEAPAERVLHAPAVHFKGSGFYNTDYGTRKRARELKNAGEGKSAEGKSSESNSGEIKSGDSGSTPAPESKPKADAPKKSEGVAKSSAA